MGIKIQMVGRRTGKLLVLEEAGVSPKSGSYLWKCMCDCGNEIIVCGKKLRNGHTKSCGCIGTNNTHNMSRAPEYRAWVDMRRRCNNKNDTNYYRYGGRGITVCERWQNSFDAFISDMGSRPSKKHSIDRIDNNGPYSPENCHWATSIQQMRNTRNNNTFTYMGITACISTWAEKYNLPFDVLQHRLVDAKWNIKKALETPIGAIVGRPKKEVGIF